GVRAPIISITSLAKNDEDPEDAESWDSLTEGPGDGSSYMLLQSGLKDLGYALWFYDNFPLVGPKRVRATYQYGWNVDADIIADYCTYGASIKVLQAVMNSNDPTGMVSFDGGDIDEFLPRHYRDLIRSYREDRAKIEADHFPGRKEAGFEVV
ncbi:MAG: hypothetical protein ACYTFZ_08425, partial [Planctomycetota bacterium]